MRRNISEQGNYMDVVVLLGQIINVGGDFLSEAGKKALSEYVIILGIILFFLRGHFKKIEAGLASVAKNVSDLGNALTHVETSHAERIGRLESEVIIIKQTITKE
jgi:hypothetical protein